jgi:DNA-directed RNA polymerase specialized sigma24 family protein
MAEPPTAVTGLLQAWHAGDATALDQLTSLYDELRRRARRDLRDEERWRDTLRPTAVLVAPDDALAALAATDPRKARVVEIRFFGGLPNGEIADALAISTDTVTRDWQMAKLWLRRDLGRRKARR